MIVDLFCHPSRSTLFPYTTLFRSMSRSAFQSMARLKKSANSIANLVLRHIRNDHAVADRARQHHHARGAGVLLDRLDRKSTRLNSSHRCNSYAVFCLTKKTSTALT